MELKNFLASVFLVSTLSACKSGDFPEFHGKIWRADADQVGIKHVLEDDTVEFISASDQRFSNYVCMSDPDIYELYQNMLKCKKWQK